MASESKTAKKECDGPMFPCRLEAMPEDFCEKNKRRDPQESDSLVQEMIEIVLMRSMDSDAVTKKMKAMQSNEMLALVQRLEAAKEKQSIMFVAKEALWAWVHQHPASSTSTGMLSETCSKQETEDAIAIMMVLFDQDIMDTGLWVAAMNVIQQFNTRHAFQYLWDSRFNGRLLFRLAKSTFDDKYDNEAVAMLQVVCTIAAKDLDFLEEFVSLRLINLLPKALACDLRTHDRHAHNILEFCENILTSSKSGGPVLLGVVGIDTFVQLIRRAVKEDIAMHSLLPLAFRCVRALFDVAESAGMGSIVTHVSELLASMIVYKFPARYDKLGSQMLKIIRADLSG